MPINRTVNQGDSTISLSEEYGHFAPTIWDYADNAELKKKRSDMNVLMPGDVVVIPDKRLKYEKRPTGNKHKVRRKGIPALFRFQIFDQNIPRKNQHYTLTVDGQEKKGTTDGSGVLQEYIPPQAKDGTLVVGDDEFTLNFKFGYLDPINEINGIQQRLNNLGYDCGDEEGEIGKATEWALLRFQRANKLELTGKPDDATKKKLEEIHDNPFDYPQQPKAGS